MKNFFISILLCTQIYSEVKAEVVTSAVESADVQTSNSACAQYAKQHPDLVDDLDLSSSNSMKSIPFRQRAKLCMDGVLAVWKDTIKELLVDPYVYMAKTTPTQTKAFLDNCNKSEICKNQLFDEAYGRLPSDIENKMLSSKMSFAELDILFRNAKSRMNSTGEQHRRLRNELFNRNWLDGKLVDKSEVLNSSQEDASIWSALKDILNQEKQKWSCLKSEAAQELFCYYLAQIIDPTIAAGVISKAPKLSKLAGFTSKNDKIKIITNADIPLLPTQSDSLNPIKTISFSEFNKKKNDLPEDLALRRTHLVEDSYYTDPVSGTKKVYAPNDEIDGVRPHVVANNSLNEMSRSDFALDIDTTVIELNQLNPNTWNKLPGVISLTETKTLIGKTISGAYLDWGLGETHVFAGRVTQIFRRQNNASGKQNYFAQIVTKSGKTRIVPLSDSKGLHILRQD